MRGAILRGALPVSAQQLATTSCSCSPLVAAAGWSHKPEGRRSGDGSQKLTKGTLLRALFRQPGAGTGRKGGAPGGRQLHGRGGAVLAAAAQPGLAGYPGQRDNLGPRICILGGGFGGLYTAVRLEYLTWPAGTKPQVTLIDKSDRFVFKPLLYELISGAATEEEVAPPFTQLLAPYSTRFVQGSVAAVELQPEASTSSSRVLDHSTGGTVVLNDGARVEYDWLVLALGAETSTFGIPGVKELALPFCSFRDVQRITQQLRILEAAPTTPQVVVVGAGYAGIELATTVAERLRGRAAVSVITAFDDILVGSPPGQVEAARRSLSERGIAVTSGAMVTRIERAQQQSLASTSAADPDAGRRRVHYKSKTNGEQVLEADLVLWTAGSAPVTRAGAAALQLPFPTNSRGAVETEPTLRVLRHRRVFALGDLAGVDPALAAEPSAPTTAQVAFQQADYVAWNLWAAINSRPLLPFKYQHLGEMMSLGRVNGAVTLPLPVPAGLTTALQQSPLGSLMGLAGIRVSPNGNAEGVTLEGPLAGALRRAAYLYRQPTNEQRLRVGASWVQQFAEGAQRVLAGKDPYPKRP